MARQVEIVLVLTLIFVSGLSAAVPPSLSQSETYTWAGAWDGTFWSSGYYAGTTPFKMILQQSGNTVTGTIEWESNGKQYKGDLQGKVSTSKDGARNYSHVNGTWKVTVDSTTSIWPFLMTMQLPPGGDGSEFGGGHGDIAAHWSGKRSTKILRTHLPVIFIPGIGGTELNYGKDQVWPIPYNNVDYAWAYGDFLVFRLGLAADGKTPYDISTTPPDATVNVGDIIRTGWADTYGTMIKSLTDSPLNYKEDKDLFIFEYDWRLDNQEHLKPLDEIIDYALWLNGVDKVVLLAHSMGGLISRAYILSNPSRANKVDSLISIGTPFWGAPKVFYALTMGYNFGDPFFTQERMKYVLQNFTSGYELLPRKEFIYDEVQAAWLDLDESYMIHYKGFEYVEIADYLKKSLNDDRLGLLANEHVHYSSLSGNPVITISPSYDYMPTQSNIYSLASHVGALNAADDFYRTAGTPENPTPFPESVKHYSIVGHGIPTVTQYNIRDAKPGESYVELWWGRKVVLEPVFNIYGDGQVPWWSARAGEENSLFGSGELYVVGNGDGGSSQHGELTKNTKVQAIVASILSGKPVKPGYLRVWEAEGDGVDYSIHSDAHLQITDQQTDATLGYNQYGYIEESLPGTFLSMDGVEYAAISGVSGKHKVTVNGIKNGSFTLELTVRNAGGSIKFQYPDVSVVNGTVAQFVYTPSEVTKTSQPALSVTSEGTTTTINAVILSVSEPTQTTGSLRIFVKDEKNALLSGVVVSSTSQPAGQVTLNGVTDSLGSVEFKSAASGTYSLMASKKGYDSSTVSIVVMNGKTGEVTIVIKQGFIVIPDNPLEVPGYPPQSIVLGIILSLALLIVLRARHDRWTYE